MPLPYLIALALLGAALSIVGVNASLGRDWRDWAVGALTGIPGVALLTAVALDITAVI